MLCFRTHLLIAVGARSWARHMSLVRQKHRIAFEQPFCLHAVARCFFFVDLLHYKLFLSWHAHVLRVCRVMLAYLYKYCIRRGKRTLDYRCLRPWLSLYATYLPVRVWLISCVTGTLRPGPSFLPHGKLITTEYLRVNTAVECRDY